MAGVTTGMVRFQVNLHAGVLFPFAIVEPVAAAMLDNDVIPAALFEWATVFTCECGSNYIQAYLLFS